MARPPLFPRRKPLRPAAPLTPELIALRPRAMMWCGLAIVMLLINMTLKGRPMLAVMTALVVARAFWMLWRYLRGQLLSDVAFWTPVRVGAWAAGQRDMALIARMEEQPVPLLLPRRDDAPALPTQAAPASVDPESCCCASARSGGLVQ